MRRRGDGGLCLHSSRTKDKYTVHFVSAQAHVSEALCSCVHGCTSKTWFLCGYMCKRAKAKVNNRSRGTKQQKKRHTLVHSFASDVYICGCLAYVIRNHHSPNSSQQLWCSWSTLIWIQEHINNNNNNAQLITPRDLEPVCLYSLWSVSMSPLSPSKYDNVEYLRIMKRVPYRKITWHSKCAGKSALHWL